MNRTLNVLSLFDGISVGRLALERVGVRVDKYYASEIDKYAEQISASNWSDIERLGSVSDYPLWHEFRHVQDIDLLMAGSPCQGFSFAGKQLAFDDPRSKLYFDFVECIKEFQPRFVLLENVVMKREFQDVISETMQAALDTYGGGTIHKTQINSALVCAQNRKRIYWTNWPVSQPDDRGILLRDILLSDGCEGHKPLSEKELAYMNRSSGAWANGNRWVHAHDGSKDKSQCLVANISKGVPYNVIDLSTLEVDASRYEGLLGGVGDMVQLPHGNNSGGRRCKDGKTPSLTSSSWHHNNMLIDDYNQRIKTDGKACTLTPNSGASAFRNGQKVVEWRELDEYNERCQKQILKNSKSPDEKSIAVCTNGNMTGSGVTTLIDGPRIRKLHPVECARLQTLPDDYCEKAGVSNTQKYRALGNGWTCEVIAHIFKCNEELTGEQDDNNSAT
jgi:DNA-cytosine methyltransferase